MSVPDSLAIGVLFSRWPVAPNAHAPLWSRPMQDAIGCALMNHHQIFV